MNSGLQAQAGFPRRRRPRRGRTGSTPDDEGVERVARRWGRRRRAGLSRARHGRRRIRDAFTGDVHFEGDGVAEVAGQRLADDVAQVVSDLILGDGRWGPPAPATESTRLRSDAGATTPAAGASDAVALLELSTSCSTTALHAAAKELAREVIVRCRSL